jgi:transcriptional regulator with XRE-family HTH domain
LSPDECRLLRERLGWTRAQLALAAGLYDRTVENFECGRTRPQPRTVVALRRALRRGLPPEPGGGLR